MPKKIRFTVNMYDFDREMATEYAKAKDALEKAAKALTEAFGKSDRVRAIRDISAVHEGSLSKFSVYPRIEGQYIVAETHVELDDDVPVKPYLNITEKTLNALLNGKLLDDGQKKSLLKRFGVELDTPAL
jgi:SHS2 domain-containing protein